ncbi:metal-dependent hydrolase [Belnapia rosea]|uniref:Inner membrane protein n=1 Tax=Belnapia rosea TaxID=938405 RepID=A0A1G6SQ29_9PROT|nr:metal-dependent hydrolase [Belnapia rosea]SDD18731.1 inner membrane protein [Belnapia rosea]
MMAGSHIALGMAAWMAAAPHLGQPPLAPGAMALAALGGLLPDIDHPKSWVGRRVRPVSDILAALLGHRGVTHSLLAVVGCWLLLRHQAVPVAWAAPIIIGYLSHLGADLLTPGGLRLAWPLRGTWALPLCRTGSAFEPLVVALLIAAAWASLPQRPDPRTLAERWGLCFTCEALPLPPPAPPRPPRRRLAAQSTDGSQALADARQGGLEGRSHSTMPG